MEKSKKIFSDILGQEIKMDFGRCVEFTGGFSIWEKPYALKMMCLGSEDNSKQSNGENTTDTPGFESMWLLVALSVIFVINRRHK